MSKDSEYAKWRAAHPEPKLELGVGFFPDGSVNVNDPAWDFLDEGAEDKMKLKEAIP